MKSFRGCWIVCLAVALPLAVVADDAAMLRQMRDAGLITEDEFRKFAAKETVKTEVKTVVSSPHSQKNYSALTVPEESYSSTPILLAFAGSVALPYGKDWDVHGFGVGLPAQICHDLSGIDIGLILGVNGRLCGVQVGLFNIAHKGAGLQLGGINVCKDLTGVQIGLINYSAKSAIPVMPIVNMRF